MGDGPSWLRDFFDERQIQEVEFCLVYVRQFRHGTDGHNGRIVLAKLARLIHLIDEIDPDVVKDAGMRLMSETDPDW